MNETAISRPQLVKPVVLIGMMGAGKTSVGKKLAQMWGLSFVDSDHEIEKAAGMSVSEIFAKQGEAEFRAAERRVISRLLQSGLCVLSVGGGAFINDETRAAIKDMAVSVWITADEAVLLERATRHGTRPLLQGDNPAEKMHALLQQRNPIYAEANISFVSDNRPLEVTAQRLAAAITQHLA